MSDLSRWQTIAQETVFRNRWLSVIIDQVILPNGEVYDYTRVQTAAVGVAVIGFNATFEVLLEREYRHGVGEVIWQLPGGLQDTGESLQAAGLRELREETGYSPASTLPGSVQYLGSIWDNPAFGPAQSHIFAAWDLQPVGGKTPDQGEYITLHWRSSAWLREAIASGKIQDRVVVAAVCYLLLRNLFPQTT